MVKGKKKIINVSTQFFDIRGCFKMLVFEIIRVNYIYLLCKIHLAPNQFKPMLGQNVSFIRGW